MSRLRASAYEVITINKEGKSVDITGADPDGPITTSFDYYESLLSPTVTAKLSFNDTGSSTNYSSEYDRQESLGTVFNAFPLIGGEEIKVKISSSYQESVFDFTSEDKLFINKKADQIGKDSTREVTILNLTSTYDTKAGQTLIKNTLRGRISDLVKKMLQDNFGADCGVDPTKNSIEIQGGLTPIFEHIIHLARQSRPENGYPGYFFYQTQDGFKFHSIDHLISQPPVAEYFYTGVLKANVCNDTNGFKIIKYSISDTADSVNALDEGLASSSNIVFDPITGKATLNPNPYDNPNKLGGQKQAVPIKPSSNPEDVLTIKTTIDTGSNNPKVSGNPNNPSQTWEVQSKMRYLSLFTQKLNIQVPCNLKLRVGNVIYCNFEKISQSNKASESTDPVQSGKYLIVNLCHHFDPKYSITSMTIVRDTYGKYSSSLPTSLQVIPFE